VELGRNENGTGISVVGLDFTLDLAALDASGRPLMVDERGALVVQPGNGLVTRGSGFAPGSRVGVYLNPPVLSGLATRSTSLLELGEVTADDNGEFVGEVDFPAELAAGERILQIVGAGSDGSVRMVALGVQVVETADPPSTVIVITGSRDGRLVQITGVAENRAGERLVPLLRFPGQTGFTAGRARPVVRDDGTFTWQRRTGKKIAVAIGTQDGSARSAPVVIRSR
jgi:hypothetical protein